MIFSVIKWRLITSTNPVHTHVIFISWNQIHSIYFSLYQNELVSLWYHCGIWYQWFGKLREEKIYNITFCVAVRTKESYTFLKFFFFFFFFFRESGYATFIVDTEREMPREISGNKRWHKIRLYVEGKSIQWYCW